MAINDLLDNEFVGLCVIIWLVISALGYCIKKLLKAKNIREIYKIYGDDEFCKIKCYENVRIVAKRMVPHPLDRSFLVNMAVFELASGNRLEFAIKDDNKYGVMVEGDSGKLHYQGKRFIEFERNLWK